MTDAALIAAAFDAQARAYARYSGFKVGAALLAADGRIFTGANVENISFGLTMCAERVAVGTAIQAGAVEFVRLAIATDAAIPTVPCGACRQVLAEFNPLLKILSATRNGKTQHFSLDSLLPLSRQGILE